MTCGIGPATIRGSWATSGTPVSGFPTGTPDEMELHLRWLAFRRGAVLGKVAGLTDERSRWRPGDRLLPLLGLVNHLTHVEWRWIDGEMPGRPTDKAETGYFPGPELTPAAAVTAYRERAAATDAAVRELGDRGHPAAPATAPIYASSCCT